MKGCQRYKYSNIEYIDRFTVRGSIQYMKKPFHLIAVLPIIVLAVLGDAGLVRAQTINPRQQDISLAGSPFAVTTTPDGQYVFASLSGAATGIAIIKQGTISASLIRVLPTGGGVFGLTVTPDGKYLLDTVQ